MKFSLAQSLEVLERTPDVLIALLQQTSPGWTETNEGINTWSPYDVVGHLIEGEKTDWVPRMDIILSGQPDKTFEPFDRFAQMEESKGKSLPELLEEFKALRQKNIGYLLSKNITGTDLQKTGIHPDFGEVTLAQLLATWTVHDLNHIAQITRVMACQYKAEVGPWIEYLRILR